MNTRGRALSPPVLAALALIACAAARGEASYSETVRLVRSMREDELMLAGLQSRLPQDVKAGKYLQADADCMARMKYPVITDAIALVISGQLTDAEVAEAIAFYRSDIGRKFTEHTYQELKNNLPPDTRYLSKAEQAALGKFAKRPVGRKLLQDRISQGPAVLAKAAERLQIGIEDCAVVNGRPGEPRINSCKTLPLVSPDNACAAGRDFSWQEPEQQPQQIAPSTTVKVECINKSNSRLWISAEYAGRVEDLGIKWLDAGTLEVMQPAGVKVKRRYVDPQVPVKMEYRTRRGDHPPPEPCWPEPEHIDAINVQMDPFASQPFWITYADDQRCLLSKRLSQSELPQAKYDTIVQFRKLKTPERPFGTADLVFFEEFSRQVHTRAIRVVGPDMPAVDMQPGAAIAGFHLIGAAAQDVLKRLAAGSALELQVEPATGVAFKVPLSNTDLDWALPAFESCVQAP